MSWRRSGGGSATGEGGLLRSRRSRAVADIIEYPIQNFGEARAHACTAQIAARIEALVAGTGPGARRCELLMQGVRDASGLTFYREGSHFLILRENPDTLEVVEILHGRMNLDEHLERLAMEGRQSRSGP